MKVYLVGDTGFGDQSPTKIFARKEEAAAYADKLYRPYIEEHEVRNLMSDWEPDGVQRCPHCAQPLTEEPW